MSDQLLQPPKGFRDFLPAQKRVRDFVQTQIKKTFERFGFEPLETPTLEYASLLLGKYGTEADKLVFKFSDRGGREVALRYDQTVPTARVLAQYQNELSKYFRRFQIQNTFRAEKPQKGRYREFTQCDADIFGSTDPVADAEIIAVFYQIFADLNLPDCVLRLNDRATLISTITPYASDSISVYSIIQSLDKLDKLQRSQIIDELVSKGLSPDSAANIINSLDTLKPSQNLQDIISYAKSLGVPERNIQFTPSLARGLDYYTGLIFEGTIPSYSGGSVGGGGRYDNLIKQLSGINIPAVGFGLGFDRTVEALTELNKLPPQTSSSKALVALFDPNTVSQSLVAAKTLRENDISTQLYPVVDKLGKQFAYADKLKIPFVLLIGSDEAAKSVVTLKNMSTGEQTTDPIEKIVTILKS